MKKFGFTFSWGEDDPKDPKEVKKEKSSQDSDPSRKTPDSKTMSFEKVSQGIALLLGVGTILSLILAPLAIISYSKTIQAPFLLPIMMSTVSFKMFLFFLVFVSIIILLPAFLGIYATFIVGPRKMAECSLYLKTACIAILIASPLSLVYITPYEFFAGRVKLLALFFLLLLLPPIIAALTSIIWRSNLEKKELSGENQSGSSTKSSIGKKFYPLILAIIAISLLTASQPIFAEGFFRWMGYGDFVVEIVKIDSKGTMKDTIKGCLLFNSGKEIYVQINSTGQSNSSQLNSSCSRQGQPSEWVIKFADNPRGDDFSLNAPGSIIRIPYKKFISFVGPKLQSSTTAVPSPK